MDWIWWIGSLQPLFRFKSLHYTTPFFFFEFKFQPYRHFSSHSKFPIQTEQKRIHCQKPPFTGAFIHKIQSVYASLVRYCFYPHKPTDSSFLPLRCRLSIHDSAGFCCCHCCCFLRNIFSRFNMPIPMQSYLKFCYGLSHGL